ncbi:hypothetical protein ACU1JV_24575 [Paenibacillus sp. T2-29]
MFKQRLRGIFDLTMKASLYELHPMPGAALNRRGRTFQLSAKRLLHLF